MASDRWRFWLDRGGTFTDLEVRETNFPVLLEEFSIGYGSGGAGRYKGGDGAVRRLRFFKAMDAGIFVKSAQTPSFGLAGGQDAAAGVNRIERDNGRSNRSVLPHRCICVLAIFS